MFKSKQQIKQEIINGLSSFQTRIVINHSQGGAIFEEVLRENPQLLFYVSRYSSSARAFALSPSVVVNLSYSNTEIPLKSVHKTETREELEALLHRSVESAQLCVVACAPIDMPIDKIYSDFSVAYNGYYSNLLNTSYVSTKFRSFGKLFVIYTFRYRIGRVKLNMMERQVDEEVLRLSRMLFLPEMTKEEKALIAHNYLAKTVEYWKKDDADPLDKSYMQSAYGALINHRCVCQGYAEAYKKLLDYEGIECQVICGKVKGSQSYHAWNVISFDKRVYYHVDVTWDSLGAGAIDWDHFCLSDTEMQATRLWSRRPGVICNSTKSIKDIARQRLKEKKLSYIHKGIDGRYL